MEEFNDPLALTTRDIADGKVIKTVTKNEELENFSNFTTERLVKQQKSLFCPIRKNRLALFKTPSKKLATKEKREISYLKRDGSLFSRLFISCKTRNKNLDKFFMHENQACPPSVSLNGELRLPSEESKRSYCVAWFCNYETC